MPKFTDRLKAALSHAWNAFRDEKLEDRVRSHGGSGASFSWRPDKVRMRYSNERSIIASIYMRLGIDASSVDIRHVRRDQDGRYLEDISSGLQNCMTLEANIDQAATHFRQDIFQTLFDRGHIAIVPVDTTVDPSSTGFDIKTLRVGTITEYFPRHVRVNVYNVDKGQRQDITLEKNFVAIVENPLYTVMNEPNSTLQRLIRKLNLLDVVDEQSSSGKLDLIIQLPYVVKSEAKRMQAMQRKSDLDDQLHNSKYGVAYIDGTEKITQLNRPAENNLLKQVEILTELLYTQLGLTTDVMNGTADEATMRNYHNRTIKPLVTAVMEAMRRAYLTKTARAQGQWIMAFQDLLSMVPIKDMAEIGDKFTRNEIASANDMRMAIGWKPSKDPKADELRNSNMPAPSESIPQQTTTKTEGDSQNGSS